MVAVSLKKKKEEKKKKKKEEKKKKRREEKQESGIEERGKYEEKSESRRRYRRTRRGVNSKVEKNKKGWKMSQCTIHGARENRGLGVLCNGVMYIVTKRPIILKYIGTCCMTNE